MIQRHRRSRLLLRRMVRAPFLLLAVAVLLVFLLAAVFPAWIVSGDPHEQALRARLLPPGSIGEDGRIYWLGSDHLGRDVLSRLVHGARASLLVGVTSASLAVAIGVTAGLIAGYYGGLADDLLMRLADVQLAFPFLLLAITVVAILGPSVPVVITVVGLAGWVVYARVIRSEVLELREFLFVDAARALGLSSTRILIRHILPNTMPSIMVLATLNLAFAIIAEAGLSFVGLGLPTKYISWGDMLSIGRQYVATAWWLATFPGASIFLVTLAINLLGDFMRESFDPFLIG